MVLAFGIAYGFVARVAFAPDQALIVSWSVFFILPFFLGALVAFLGCEIDRPSDLWTKIAPAASFYLGLILTSYSKILVYVLLGLAFPGLIFVFLMVAIAIAFPSIVGGLLVGLLLEKRVK